MLRSPKERFIASIFSGTWGKLVQSEAYEEAVTAALGQFSVDQPEAQMPQQACDAHQQLVGAKKVLDILSTLHVPLTPTKTTQRAGLDYSAGV